MIYDESSQCSQEEHSDKETHLLKQIANICNLISQPQCQKNKSIHTHSWAETQSSQQRTKMSKKVA